MNPRTDMKNVDDLLDVIEQVLFRKTRHAQAVRNLRRTYMDYLVGHLIHLPRVKFSEVIEQCDAIVSHAPHHGDTYAQESRLVTKQNVIDELRRLERLVYLVRLLEQEIEEINVDFERTDSGKAFADAVEYHYSELYSSTLHMFTLVKQIVDMVNSGYAINTNTLIFLELQSFIEEHNYA